ncbi:MAG: acetolactate synthase large subunit [Candidatus Electrothrix communis]|nr:acetolactate synthase large subunit [Desulfobulbus sp. US4]WLE95956.1 MAG: acetolactate synthase large subunit [Candidatus Electrothrix communis]
MNGAELMVKCLENEGVEYIFGIPGEENLAFLEALRSSSIKLILTRHEQAAGFMAATYGRITGKPGVCIATLGPGATNFVTSVSYAFLGGMPCLFITGQKPIKSSKQGRFQIINVVSMMAPITKMTRQIVGADSIATLVRESFRVAVQEKSGPVHLELPEDIAAEQTRVTPFPLTPIRKKLASNESFEEVAEIIKKAKNPLLLIAAASNRHHQAGTALEHFIEQTGIHFFSTQMGKGAANEFHPRCLGTAALSDHDYLHCAIGKADVIINVGHDIVEKPPFFMQRNGLVVIHINYFHAVFDEVYFPQHEVIGDIADSMQRLAALITPNSLGGDGYFNLLKKEIDKHVYKRTLPATFPYTPQQLTRVLRELMDKDSILSLDNGMYKIWFARNYRSTNSHSVLLDNALATMGAGLPVAIAAKMLFPEKKVVAVCGDGGFMMNSQEMETAIRLKLDLVILLIRDDAFGMIKWKQGGMGLPAFGLDFGNPDFVKYAESYGARGYRGVNQEQLAEVLEHCLDTPGVHLIELPIDYAENESVLTEELKRKTCLLG